MRNERDGAAGGRVLIVDDDARIRELCCTIVASGGMQPFEAADGVEAIERLAALKPGHMLLDVNLPGRSGMEILREVRVRFPETRGVIITGEAAVDLAGGAVEVGGCDLYSEPC